MLEAIFGNSILAVNSHLPWSKQQLELNGRNVTVFGKICS